MNSRNTFKSIFRFSLKLYESHATEASSAVFLWGWVEVTPLPTNAM